MRSACIVLVSLVVFWSCGEPEKKVSNNILTSDSGKTIKAIPKTSKATIIDPKFPLSLLFGIWTVDSKGPHADFVLDSSCFFIVDYDGDGTMAYTINKDSLIINYGDYINKTIILAVDKDSLHLKAEDGTVSNYVRWKNEDE